jgi:hypothetical protein
MVILFIWQGCDVRSASQEQVRQKMESGLRPYFPRVQVALDRDQQQLTAYTCVSNLGQAAVNAVPAILDSSPDFRRLKEFHGVLRLRSFAIVFDRLVLTLDFDGNRYQTVPLAQLAGAASHAAQICGQTPL